MFKNLDMAINWVQSQTRFRPKASLIHIEQAFKLMNLDLSDIKKIHITGTNGKGSVSMNITQMLMEQGFTVGTFTSPYLVKFNERIQINRNPISDDDLLNLINDIYNLKEKYLNISNESLSFFELLTLAAFKYFSLKYVDYMVIEVGIGGLLDSTNILNYDVSVITNIGMDHMKQLGDTKEKIAIQKLGILKEKGVLFTTVDESLHSLFINTAQKLHAKINIIDSHAIKTISYIPHIVKYKNYTFELPLLGVYQKDNAILAYEVVKYLLPKTKDEELIESLKHVQYAGRLENVKDNIFIDGAHNEHAINALIESIKLLFSNKKVYILFSALADKEPEHLIGKFENIAEGIIVTSFPDVRFKPLNNIGYLYIEDPKKALNFIQSKTTKDDVILITGSIHFIGYMKAHIL